MSLWQTEYSSFTATEMTSALITVSGILPTSWEHPNPFPSSQLSLGRPLFIHSFNCHPSSKSCSYLPFSPLYTRVKRLCSWFILFSLICLIIFFYCSFLNRQLNHRCDSKALRELFVLISCVHDGSKGTFSCLQRKIMSKSMGEHSLRNVGTSLHSSYPAPSHWKLLLIPALLFVASTHKLNRSGHTKKTMGHVQTTYSPFFPMQTGMKG